MTAKYKGVLTPLTSIPIGTPVEVTSPEEFKIPSGLPSPLLGVLTGVNGDHTKNNHSTPSLSVWDGSRFNLTSTLYSKDYNPNSYRNLGVPNSSTYISVLTGTKRNQLSEAYREHQFQGNLDVLTGVGRTCGADPEIFVVDENGTCIPAWEFLPPKGLPLVHKNIYGSSANASAYWDGFQAEFSIDANSCSNGTVDSLHRGLKLIHKASKKKFPSSRLSLSSVLPISEQRLRECTREQVSLGCLPSLNAYGPSGAGQTVDDPASLPFRFAGGHIHLGETRTHQDPEKYVRLLDRVVGVASVGMFQKMDNPLRRRFYGCAGEYRLPEHGLEYRVLSNAWLCHPALAFWMFDMCRAVLAMASKGMGNLVLGEETEAQRIINEYDVPAAQDWVRRNEKLYRALAEKCYGEQTYMGGGHVSKTDHCNVGDVTMSMILNGVHTILDPHAIVDNWMLDAEEGKSSGTVEEGRVQWLTHAESEGKMFKSLCKMIWKGQNPGLAGDEAMEAGV